MVDLKDLKLGKPCCHIKLTWHKSKDYKASRGECGFENIFIFDFVKTFSGMVECKINF